MKPFTFFVHMNATREWLKLSHQQRDEFFNNSLGQIMARYEDVRVRLFDVEAFSTKCSDIAMFETENLQAYTFMMDALRDSEFYTVPYFEIVDIYPAIEESFRDYVNTVRGIPTTP